MFVNLKHSDWSVMESSFSRIKLGRNGGHLLIERRPLVFRCTRRLRIERGELLAVPFCQAPHRGELNLVCTLSNNLGR